MTARTALSIVAPAFSSIARPLNPIDQYYDRNESTKVGLSPDCVGWSRNWTPSIVPGGHDETVYSVADDFGRIGRAWIEADYEGTDLETVLHDLILRFQQIERGLVSCSICLSYPTPTDPVRLDRPSVFRSTWREANEPATPVV